MSRLFIMRSIGFPHGSPSANYIQNLASAFKMQKWEVIVIGTGQNRRDDYWPEQNKYIYNGIEYYNYTEKNQIEKSFYYSPRFAKELINRYKFFKEDYAIFYTPDYFYARLLHRFIPYKHMLTCRVEQIFSYQYQMGYLNPKYLVYKKGIRHLHKKIRKALPISSYLQSIDEAQGCKTLRLPPMVDPFEYDYKQNKVKTGVIKIIYPGFKKFNFEDDVLLALKALENLSRVVLPSIEFHITGISQEKFFEKYDMEGILHRLQPFLRIHGWLQYEELVALYQDMDFILLCRKENQITMANFPSKIPELMCYGVIPVCTRVGDYTKYFLKDGYNSILFDSGSVAACSKAINKAINLPYSMYNAMRAASSRTAKKEFAYVNWAKKLHDFILD